MQLPGWLATAAQAYPHHIALIEGDQQWTYADLLRDVSDYAGRLAALGVRRDMRVGVLMPNSALYITLVYALIELEAVLVPLNTRLTREEIGWQVERAGCGLMLFDDSLRDKGPTGLIIPAYSVQHLSAADMHSITAHYDLDRVQAIIFTSGTTGQPKGAQVSFGNVFWSATISAFRLGSLPQDRWLLTLPLYHVGGLSIVFRCCLYGTTVVLQNGFEPNALLDIIERHRVTLVSLVPTMLHRLLDLDRPFPASLRLILLGGAAASPTLLERSLARHLPVATTYGLTETASQVATMLPEDVQRKPGSVGKALPFMQVNVVDDDNQPCTPNQIGQIVVQGLTVIPGYLDDIERERFSQSLFYTGDLGYLDEDGDLWVVQRRSDLIVSGGENVYPAEVEYVLSQHPSVAEAVVVGLPSEEWGQQVAAAVVLKPDALVTADALNTFCRQQLAAYKVPRRFVIVDELPQTASGKVSRRLVAEMMVGE